MPSVRQFVTRSSVLLSRRDFDADDSDKVMDLMLAFFGIAFFCLMLVAMLVVLRRMRRQQMRLDEMLPQYNDIKHCEGRNTNRLTIQTPDGRSSILVVNGRPMLADPNEPPHSPHNVPEIHITFPDEQDEHGRQQSGRVVVVRVGDATYGLEPVKDEQLPAYEKESSNGFYSIDMDNIGGLKEKDRSQFS
ncbi:hypothetical protein DL766_006679 [Monosporascus sp. MC13-8B]|uniref:Uncharacterized protein n=1 Tax=Monosporascus cannonballus TaxID=155416 RepID=A0ABY0H089_9PEZI|nr:hypothetical protein DL763_010507 [Monosporascus cannonballus]RYO81502.1 hypothetical protein DL762_007079 [Monosporascus cannonballus]RYP26599.1 hypothetical protein DL766_006679 [Monosporascus sp. MC13-8B]